MPRKRKKKTKSQPTAPLISEGKREQWVFLPLTMILTAVAYALTICPTVYVGDSGELSAAAYTLGIPHSPGYPLYCLIGWLFAHAPFGGDVGFHLNVMSAVFAWGTVMILYMIIYHFTRTPYLSFSVSLAYAFSPIFWSQAVVAEVYCLNTFLTALALYFMCRWVEKRDDYWLYFTSLTAGLAGTNHQLSLLLLPTVLFMMILFGESKGPEISIKNLWGLWTILLIRPVLSLIMGTFDARMIFIPTAGLIFAITQSYKGTKVSITNLWLLTLALLAFYQAGMVLSVFTNGLIRPGGLTGFILPTVLTFLLLLLSRYKKPLKFWLILGGLYALGLLVYIYLPIRAAASPPLNWGNPETFGAFIENIFKPAGSQVSTGSTNEHVLHALYLWTIQFSPVIEYRQFIIPIPIIWAFGIWGIYKGLSTGWRMAKVFLWFMFLNIGTILTVSRPHEQELMLVGVYYLPVFLVFTVFMATGLREWLQTFSRAFGEKKRPVLLGLVILILVLIPLFQFDQNRRSADRSNDYYALDYETALLNSVPPDSILIVNWDDIFTIWYLQEVEHVNPSVIPVLPNFPLAGGSNYWGDWYYKQLREEHPELFKGVDFENSRFPSKEKALEAFVNVNLARKKDVYFSFYGLEFKFELFDDKLHIFPRGPAFQASFGEYNPADLIITQQVWEKTLSEIRNVYTYREQRIEEEDFIIFRISDNLTKCGQLALALNRVNQTDRFLGQADWFLEKAVKVDNGNVQAIILLATLKFESGMYPEAESLLIEASEIDDKNTEVLLYLGLLYQERGQPELAEQAYLRILAIDPYHPDATSRLQMIREQAAGRTGSE